MSNGFSKIPMHRVMTNAEKERLWLAMFYTMDLEKEIEPVPDLVDEKRPRRYRKIKTKDYLREMYESFARGKPAIDIVKI
jgi:isopenicillin N synthase-like dioxygenase